MIPGIYDISNEEYHSSEGLSRSAIMELRRTPAHYHNRYMLKEKGKQTTAMGFGDALHKFIMEPNLFNEQFVVMPDMDGRTTEAKNLKAKILSSGKNILSSAEFAQLRGMKDSFFADEFAPLLLQESLIEKSIYFNDVKTNVLCKSRPDIMKMLNGGDEIWIVDLKTAIDASLPAFERAIYTYGYHIQCAMQRAAIKAQYGHDNVSFWFAVIEKSAPYCIGIYELDSSAVDFGTDEFNRMLDLYVKCQESEKWPGYGCKTVKLPSWAEYQIESFNAEIC